MKFNLQQFYAFCRQLEMNVTSVGYGVAKYQGQ